MSRLQEITEKINQYPVPVPLYKITEGWSGGLNFRAHNHKVDSPFEEPTPIEKLIDGNIERKLTKDKEGRYYFVNQVDETISCIMRTVSSNLCTDLKKALPNVEPKRTKIYKWFSRYRPHTDKEREFLLAVYNYANTNKECRDSGTKSAEAFIGLIHHLQIISKQGK